jgi:hypothetical protein
MMGTASSAALASALILCDGGLSVGGTGKPLGLDTLDVVVHGLGFLRLGRRIGLGLLLRQLTRMAHNKAQFLQRDPSLAVLPIHWAEHALPIPTTRPLVTHPPRLLYEEGQGRLLPFPGFECLPGRHGCAGLTSRA